MCRYSIQTMFRCIKRWKQSPRMIMLFAMLGCIILVYALPFAENARAQKESLQVGEVFVALTNWRFSMLIFSCSIILLFCDLPMVYWAGALCSRYVDDLRYGRFPAIHRSRTTRLGFFKPMEQTSQADRDQRQNCH